MGNWLKGKLTIIAGALLVAYGLIGWAAGLHNVDSMILMLGNGFAALGLRRNQDHQTAVIVGATVNPPSLDDIVRRNQE